jgi:hypothetical protein
MSMLLLPPAGQIRQGALVQGWRREELGATTSSQGGGEFGELAPLLSGTKSIGE